MQNLIKIVSIALFLLMGWSASAQNCNASFTYDLTHCPNVYFTANATADSTIVCWMFDYGTQGNIDFCEIAHNKFNTNGTFEVCLGIMTIDGCTDYFCDSITITCNCPDPTVGFSELTNELDVNFTDTSQASVTQWMWHFGDGTTSTQQHPNHTYAAPGTYTVCLSAGDTCGNISTCHDVTVSCAGPTADFGHSANILTVDFTESCTGNPTNWNWDFGDGNTSTAQNPTHTYTQAGTYNACLSASSICDSSTQCHSVSVINTGMEASTVIEDITLMREDDGIYNVNLSAFDGHLVQVSVYDNRGRMVQTDNNVRVNKGLSYQLNITTLPQGLYFVQFNAGSLTATAKALR